MHDFFFFLWIIYSIICIEQISGIILRPEVWSQLTHFLRALNVTQQLSKSLQELSELNLERNDLFIVYYKINSHPLWFSLFPEEYMFSDHCNDLPLLYSYMATSKSNFLLNVHLYPTIYIKEVRQFQGRNQRYLR